MSDIHALSGAYAIDALDDIERAQFERHLAHCEACTGEIESLREATALLAETSAVPPSAALRSRVLAEIATVRPLPPLVTNAAEARVPRWRRLSTLVAAAAAAVAIGTTGVVWQQMSDGPESVAEHVLTASDAQTFTQTLPGGATATVVRSEKLNEAVLITKDMPAAPTGHNYALWLQHDDVMVPAGIMPSGSDNEVLLSGDAASANGAGITIETAGDEHPEPEGDVVVVFAFDQA
ncbi:anti-sigma factor domain-containing protein [Nocardioides sp.]|uniref:anti-sigma factor n=1 Tax=Nocardioides sp. TaxID=35761 RepID=UPI0035679258